MQDSSRRESIDARHADGIVRPTSRHAYRADVLPAVLEACRADPDRLAEAILTALEAGLASDVIASAEHFGRIDADRRRRTWIPALVACHAGRFTKAEETIVRGRELFGDCADFRYVDAEILFGRHLRARAEAALADALIADPNHSRALRRTVELDLESSGNEASLGALAAVATRNDAWRARLLLSDARFSAGDRAEARRLAVEASTCEPIDAILGPLAALLAKQCDAPGLLELVLPRYDPSRHGARCGINLLYALLESGRHQEGEMLLASIGSIQQSMFEKHRAFYASAFAAIEPGTTNDRRAGVALHRALASYARHETSSARRAMVEKLFDSVLLLPLHRPVVDEPILDLGLPDPLDPAIEAVTAVDSTGSIVTLVFTGEKALASWDPRHRHRIALDAKELFELVGSLGGGAVVIDAAGPASLELSSSQVEALREGRELTERGANAPFVVEPLRADLPARVLETAAQLVRDTESIVEGFFFEMIEERSGAGPAFAILLRPEADERAVRDAVLEAKDRLVWESGRKKRKLQVMPLRDGPLTEYLRFCAIRVG